MSDDDPRYRYPRLGRPGNMRLGQGPIGPDGTLHDYEAYPGDEPPNVSTDSDANRWGGRYLFQINQPPSTPGTPASSKTGTSDVQTLIDIRTLKRTTPINVQLRFALADINGNPVLPFVWRYPFNQATLDVFVRRSSDPLSSIVEDHVSIFDSAVSGATGQVFALDVVTTQKLSVVANLNAGSGAQSLWVEAIATPVTRQSYRDEIRSWPQVHLFAYPFSNAAPAIFLVGRADRAQFIVTNTSTTGDLWLFFDNADGTGGVAANIPSIILPKGGANTYESPIGGFSGSVFGKWVGAADGQANVTEGVYHVPSTGIQLF